MTTLKQRKEYKRYYLHKMVRRAGINLIASTRTIYTSIDDEEIVIGNKHVNRLQSEYKYMIQLSYL